ncbi:hypothetical protein JCM18750_38280 [Halostagnicola bangensis]
MESRIEHDLTGNLDGYRWTAEFSVYIDCMCLNRRYDDHGVARHGYAAYVPFIERRRDAQCHYSKRFGTESSYRLSEQAIATTPTRDTTVRLLHVVVSLLLQNIWRYLHYEFVATPRRGGRRLWWWACMEFVNMIRRAAWTVLAVRRSSPQTGHLTTGSTGSHRSSTPVGRQPSTAPSSFNVAQPLLTTRHDGIEDLGRISWRCFVSY